MWMDSQQQRRLAGDHIDDLGQRQRYIELLGS
jgi:hypothetical protein